MHFCNLRSNKNSKECFTKELLMKSVELIKTAIISLSKLLNGSRKVYKSVQCTLASKTLEHTMHMGITYSS